MLSLKSFAITGGIQTIIYDELNAFSESHKTAARFAAIPVGLIDVGSDTIRPLLMSIEAVATVFINLIGAVFSNRENNDCCVKDAVIMGELAVSNLVIFPVKLFFAPLKATFQIFSGIINPGTTRSINPFRPRPPNPSTNTGPTPTAVTTSR